MIKYAKIINELTGLVEVGLGTNADFYKSIGMCELDVTQSDIDSNWYLSEKCPMKSEEDYAKEREEQFYKDFFNTSLGYVRRKVSMATGETKDFLSDLLPTISMGIQMGQPVQIITYDKPDFTQEITDWTVLQNVQTVTADFIQECFMQLSNDFKPVNNEVQDENTTDTAE